MIPLMSAMISSAFPEFLFGAPLRLHSFGEIVDPSGSFPEFLFRAPLRRSASRLRSVSPRISLNSYSGLHLDKSMNRSQCSVASFFPRIPIRGSIETTGIPPREQALREGLGQYGGLDRLLAELGRRSWRDVSIEHLRIHRDALR